MINKQGVPRLCSGNFQDKKSGCARRMKYRGMRIGCKIERIISEYYFAVEDGISRWYFAERKELNFIFVLHILKGNRFFLFFCFCELFLQMA